MASNLHAYDLWSAIMRAGGATDADVGNYWQTQAPTVLEAVSNPALDTIEGWGASGLLDPWKGGVYGTQFSPVFYEVAQQLGLTPNEASKYFSSYMTSNPQADAFDAVTQQAKATEALLRERGLYDTPQAQQLIQNLYSAGDEWKSSAKKAERADVMKGAMQFASLVSGAVGGLSALGNAGFLGAGFTGSPFASLGSGLSDLFGLGTGPDASFLAAADEAGGLIPQYGSTSAYDSIFAGWNMPDPSAGYGAGGGFNTSLSDFLSGKNIPGFDVEAIKSLPATDNATRLLDQMGADALFQTGPGSYPLATSNLNSLVNSGNLTFDEARTLAERGYADPSVPWEERQSILGDLRAETPAPSKDLDWLEGGKGIAELLDAIGSIFQGGTDTPGPELPQPLTETGEDPLNLGLFSRKRNETAGGILGGFDSFNIGAPGLFVPK